MHLHLEGGAARRAHLFPWRRGWRGAVHSLQPPETFTAVPAERRESQSRRCLSARQPAVVIPSSNRGPPTHIILKATCIKRRGHTDARTLSETEAAWGNPLSPYRRVWNELCRLTTLRGPLTTTGQPHRLHRSSGAEQAAGGRRQSGPVQGSPAHPFALNPNTLAQPTPV